MKVTFINPNMFSFKSSDSMQPLVFAILKGLTPKDIEVSFYDDRIEEIDFTEKTDLVAITVGTFTAKRAYEIAGIYRKLNIPVVMGGYHPTLLPEEVTDFCDVVVTGNAETTWKKILADFKKNSLKKVYQSEDTGNELKTWFDHGIFNKKKYFPINLIEWGRGCHYRCDFCSIQAVYKGNEYLRPVADVISDISKFDNKPVFIIDDNIYHNKSGFREFLLELIPLKKKWACQISIDVTHDDELLDLLQKSGCMMVLIGIESFNNSNLKLMNKAWNFDQTKYREAIQKFRKRKIMVYGTFIFGYDHDRVEDFNNAVKFAIKNKLFLANFNPLYPMPGTELYRRLQNSDRLCYDKWWLDPKFYYGRTMFKPVSFTPEELEIQCYHAKKKFNNIYSIIYRSMDFRANLRGITRSVFYVMANLTNRREILKKQGVKLGEK